MDGFFLKVGQYEKEDASVNESDQLLVFTLDDLRYALRLEEVDRVVRAVEVTPLIDAPECVLGIIDVRGRIVPAINLRKRFRLQEKELCPSDQFIISSTQGRTFALAADAVHGVIQCAAGTVIPATEILPRMEPVDGVILLADGIVLISDIDKFLSLEEEAALDDLLSELSGLGTAAGEELTEHGHEQ
jgi:purine-binding chemotaxis protein CheW